MPVEPFRNINQQGPYYGPAGSIHRMSGYLDSENSIAPAESNKPTETMEDMDLEDFFDNTVVAEWDSTIDYGKIGNNSTGVVAHEGSALGPQYASGDTNTPGCANSSSYANSFGPTETNDRSFNTPELSELENALSSAEWDDLLNFGQEESSEFQDFQNPASGAYGDRLELTAGEEAGLPAELPEGSYYPAEITLDGPTNPYQASRGSTRATDREWVVSRTAMLSSVPYRDENSFGGPALQSQGSVAQGYTVEPNALANPHGVVDRDALAYPRDVVDPNASANLSDVVEQDTAIDHGNDDFMPMYLTEADFRNRKAAREASRVRSDYPWDNIHAQHDILRRIYNAIRNTTDVEDSAKVAAKFADHAIIPDWAVHETCWEVMIHCRDSQELKGLLIPEYHKTKYLVKETFSERMESVIATLHKSKAVCKSIMDPLFLDRLVDQPEEELKRKTINKKLNKVKTGQNKAGQQAINHKCANKDGVWTGGLAGVVSNQAEPQEAGESGDLGEREEDDEEADAPAPGSAPAPARAPKRRRHR